MAKKMGKKQTGKILNNSLKTGIENFVKKNPQFANSQEYLLKHIDKNKLQDKYNELYQEALQEKMNKKELKNHIYSNLPEYVISKESLDDKGKEIILKSGLEEKTGFFNRLFPGPKIRGEKELNNAVEAFRDLYSLLKSGDYSKRMPELTESISSLRNLEVLNPALDIVRAYGLMDDKRYRFLKKEIYKTVREEPKKVIRSIERYIVPEKAAALIIGGIGLVLIFLNLNITGSVIGGNSAITWGIGGIFMVILALLLFFRPLKKSFKK